MRLGADMVKQVNNLMQNSLANGKKRADKTKRKTKNRNENKVRVQKKMYTNTNRTSREEMNNYGFTCIILRHSHTRHTYPVYIWWCICIPRIHFPAKRLKFSADHTHWLSLSLLFCVSVICHWVSRFHVHCVFHTRALRITAITSTMTMAR